jgi:predicted transglutaminase-like protease
VLAFSHFINTLIGFNLLNVFEEIKQSCKIKSCFSLLHNKIHHRVFLFSSFIMAALSSGNMKQVTNDESLKLAPNAII